MVTNVIPDAILETKNSNEMRNLFMEQLEVTRNAKNKYLQLLKDQTVTQMNKLNQPKRNMP